MTQSSSAPDQQEDAGRRPVMPEKEHNPFAEMGFVRFWLVSMLFWMFFPGSLVACYLALGPIRTKQLIKALINDFLQTFLVIIAVIALIIWVIIHYVSMLF